MRISATVTISTVYPGTSGGAIFSGRDDTGSAAALCRQPRPHLPCPYRRRSLVDRRREPAPSDIRRSGARGTGSLVQPTGRLIIDFLLKHPAFDGLGIGKAKATRLWTKFGSDLHIVLSQGDVERLGDVLSVESAQKLVEAWRAVAEEASVVSFLDDHGFDIRLANKVRKIWPEEALTKLRENPYRMLAFADWEKVDRMSRSLGVAPGRPAAAGRGGRSLPISTARRQAHADAAREMLLGWPVRRDGDAQPRRCARGRGPRTARARDRRYRGWLPASRGRRDGKSHREPSPRAAGWRSRTGTESVLDQSAVDHCRSDSQL